MRKSEAITVVQDAFGTKFNEKTFKLFIANLLKKYEAVDKLREGQYVREAFREFVSRYNIIGYFNDNAGNKIHVLQVFLHKGTSLSRARTAQRNFVADYLKNNWVDAALVAFIAPEDEKEDDWRFSLVKLEYSLDIKDGKSRTSEEITPAKRWSFLVGKHEGSHTAQSRFVPLLEDNKEPNLAELEGAFNIEKVTNEFFEKYCDLFLRMKESLDQLLANDADLKRDFDLKEISAVDFAKKTLGQIAFLYFLQKKGWFGVYPDREWGSGVKNFLRKLFDAREKYGHNFFDDVLEPLFYEALAQDRGKEAIYPKLNNCRMPFLNGGLFEPMNGYSWETTHISLPDELFSNEIKDEKTGDIGNGIFDVFDRYNFTVNENEPLEKEVAVDPEMLGKVFENLLEIRDRKSKGAFYTPREIVHYMCQESLINYLYSETEEMIPHEDIEIFIQKGIQIIQNDKLVLEKGRETDTYKFMLPESIRTNAEKLDTLLSDIKVCDPAVGSGAFPLGMLNEIVRARQALGVHAGSKLSPYDLKLHSISHSIYGVDIDSGAVEIAELRMWLALVVEEKDPHPLPNLEHKIMQGNSLFSEYEGIKLFDDSFLTDSRAIENEKKEIKEKLSSLQREYFDLHSKNQLDLTKKAQIEAESKQLQKRLGDFERKNKIGDDPLSVMNLFDAPTKQKVVAQEKTLKMQRKIEHFVSESRKTQKQNLKEEIDTLKWELIEATLEEEERMDKLEEIRVLRRKNIRPFFIWKLEFSEVFKENGGFDVVIGNPPYVFARSGESKGLTKKHKEYFYKSFALARYQINLYSLFLEKGKQLLRRKGVLAYIVPNNWLTINTNKDLREFVLSHANITIVNCLSRVFESASVDSSIVLFSNDTSNKYISLCEYNDSKTIELVSRTTTDYFLNKPDAIINIEALKNGEIGILIDKIETRGVQLKNIADVKAGLKAYETGKGRPPQTENMKKTRIYHTSEAIDETYLRYLEGRDVSRYRLGWSGEFLKYGENLAASRKFELFSTPRILVRQIPAKPPYCIHACYTEEILLNDLNSMNIINIQENPFYVLGILNSRLMSFWFIHKFGKLSRGIFPQFKINELEQFPIHNADQSVSSQIKLLVDQILVITFSSDYDPKKPPIRQKELEAKIDEIVFDLYELTPEEREIVLKP